METGAAAANNRKPFHIGRVGQNTQISLAYNIGCCCIFPNRSAESTYELMREYPLTADQILKVREEWLSFSAGFINYYAGEYGVPAHAVHSVIEGLSPARPLEYPNPILLARPSCE